MLGDCSISVADCPIILCRLSEKFARELHAADQEQLDYLWEASSVLAS